ncbi:MULTISPECIES: hypothetical protein [unclassified Nitratiruptor]|uniref:hypothetical protein n=1 Tax=unclassified Nitratiruptor TaxID=2624044 RepID=UPI0019167DB1|nr:MULTISPECIES: hypothetical protein [unclassified Nitratiruptor]BCD60083.1 hypothetical protein NitYY0810_C0848 [Nitratiruptor sp. YY08-10]BCD64428.1 hypothetical protein NitYY0814_C1273 [Nitratiruptor sp. YY08-14]
MRLKKYILFSLILMGLVGGLIYTQTEQTYTLEVLGIPVTLPIAVWVILPMFLMFVASFFHMAYYSFINFMRLKRYKKDYDTLIASFVNALYREPKALQYKSKEAKNLGTVSDASYLIPQHFKIDTKDERLRKVIDTLKDINNGMYVELEGVQLSPKNPILLRNIENRMKEEPTYSGVVLKNCKEYPKELCKKALRIFMDFSDIAKIKEYASLFDIETLIYLIQHVKEEKKSIEYQDILYIIQQAHMDLDGKDYIAIAREIKDVLAPDERLKLFELLKEEDEKSEAAYLYTLLDLEMIEKAREFLETTNEEELQEFKAYLELKECGKNYPLELFV